VSEDTQAQRHVLPLYTDSWGNVLRIFPHDRHVFLSNERQNRSCRPSGVRMISSGKPVRRKIV
jgi:hypothetical protein